MRLFFLILITSSSQSISPKIICFYPRFTHDLLFSESLDLIRLETTRLLVGINFYMGLFLM